MHAELTRSVKSIDQAAKIAQNLGNLMSKVAMQNAKGNNNINDTSLGHKAQQLKLNSNSTSTTKSTTTKTTDETSIDPELQHLLKLERKRNPYNPITEEIKKRADRLANVVEQAEKNLKLHSAAFGYNSVGELLQPKSHGNTPRGVNKINPSEKTTSTGTGSGRVNSNTKTTTSGSDIGFQTDSMKFLQTEPKDFEFVSDMSYTDQLMLKKLRNLKSTWGESN
jgi:hypothetical protein